MEITLEKIKKKFETLPEELQWAIMAAKVDDNIIEIGQIQGLTVEQMGQLSLQTHLIMFGFTPLDKFEESVKKSLNLPDEKIRTLVNAVNEKILKKIRNEIMKAFAEPGSVETTEKTKEAEILASAGIKIIGEKETAVAPKTTPPIFAQKLSEPFKTGVSTTEHTLGNFTKNISPADTGTAPKPAPKSGYDVDPYRMKPE